MFQQTLKESDPELSSLINDEYQRQKESLELIASENFTSPVVLECLGSILTNKYSEGYPGRRYYGGNQVIDKIEELCQQRGLKAFGLSEDEWYLNVQPYSGSPGNFAVYTGLLKPGDRIMGLGLPSGGHLTHGFYTPKKKVSATSIYFQSFPYKVKEDGWIDYDNLEETALVFNPNIIISGGSSYPRDIDYKRLRAICDKVGAYLMIDMAHINGFITTGLMKSPFEYADVVTSTTHKTLRGPRSGLIFINKKTVDKETGKGSIVQKINEAVFPGLQGGPHNHQIAGVAYQFQEVVKPEFKEYMNQVLKNARHLGNELKKYGFELMTGGTDNHILLVNLKSFGVSGSKVEYLCELVDVSLNKNCVAGDKNAMSPNGIRLGTSALTTRGFKEDDFTQVASILSDITNMCVKIQNKSGKMLVDFKKELYSEEYQKQIKELKKKVNDLARDKPFYDL